MVSFLYAACQVFSPMPCIFAFNPWHGDWGESRERRSHACMDNVGTLLLSRVEEGECQRFWLQMFRRSCSTNDPYTGLGRKWKNPRWSDNHLGLMPYDESVGLSLSLEEYAYAQIVTF